MISDEAVEAAAKALKLFEMRGDPYGRMGWDAYARAALEAAAPHMLNQAPPVAEGPSEGADAVTGFPRAAYRKRRMA